MALNTTIMKDLNQKREIQELLKGEKLEIAVSLDEQLSLFFMSKSGYERRIVLTKEQINKLHRYLTKRAL